MSKTDNFFFWDNMSRAILNLSIKDNVFDEYSAYIIYKRHLYLWLLNREYDFYEYFLCDTYGHRQKIDVYINDMCYAAASYCMWREAKNITDIKPWDDPIQILFVESLCDINIIIAVD